MCPTNRKKPLRGIGSASVRCARSGRTCSGRPTSSSTRHATGDAQDPERHRRVHPRIASPQTDRSIDADHVVSVLDRMAGRGAPDYLRFDNGPEFVAYAVADWCRFNGTGTVFIDPGSPWQNAWVECFNGRMRDEHLNGQLFDSLLEAQVLNEAWRIDYNENRPHRAHGWNTPAEFARGWPNDTNHSSHSEWISNRGPVNPVQRGLITGDENRGAILVGTQPPPGARTHLFEHRSAQPVRRSWHPFM